MASDGGGGEAAPSAEQTEPDDGLQSLASGFIEEDPSSRFGRVSWVLRGPPPGAVFLLGWHCCMPHAATGGPPPKPPSDRLGA